MPPEVLQAAVLGVVQGITEFLPVSSTGHLIVVPAIFGWRHSVVDRLEFDVALHIGTLAALLAVFWRDWAALLAAAVRSLWLASQPWRRRLGEPVLAQAPRRAGRMAAAPNRPAELAAAPSRLPAAQARLAWLIGLAAIPAVVAGVLFEGVVETTLRSPLIVGSMMVVVGLLLAVADRVGSRASDEYRLSAVAALAIGIGQALALVPGVSRSGSTIAVGLAAGLTRAAAARFSFLLSTPVVLGAVGKQSIDVLQAGLDGGAILVYAVGIAAAGLSGYASIRWLLAFLSTNSLMPFVVYRVVVGVGIIVWGLGVGG